MADDPFNQTGKTGGWDLVNQKKGEPTEQEKAAIEADKQFNLNLAKMFNTEPGKKVLEEWERRTYKRRIPLTLSNPATGQVYGNPEAARIARVAENNFILDILARIEKSNNY